MRITQWYYRGSLKSCNYQCSYCPFSKRKGNAYEYNKDEQDFMRFVSFLEGHAQPGDALLIVPYGEALQHTYYWRALARLSSGSRLQTVGAQSNFSFPLEYFDLYQAQGGILEKLRLWGSFHPEMISAQAFAEKCRALHEKGIALCAGAVGKPEHMEVLFELRRLLPETIYLWINKMDGMRRGYTQEEKAAFLEIDPFFCMELTHYDAEAGCIRDDYQSCFVEADGTVRRCNLSRKAEGNLYQKGWRLQDMQNKELSSKGKSFCGKRECSCYLAYCNLKLETLRQFLPYPAFRIPNRVTQ